MENRQAKCCGNFRYTVCAGLELEGVLAWPINQNIKQAWLAPSAYAADTQEAQMGSWVTPTNEPIAALTIKTRDVEGGLYLEECRAKGKREKS